MSDKFKIEWEAEDGYVCGRRPQYCLVDSSEIEDDMEEKALEELYYELIDEDFQRKVSAYGKNLNEFLEWAKKVIEEMNETS